MASPRIENEDGSVDGLGGKVSFESLVDGDPVDVGAIYSCMCSCIYDYNFKLPISTK